MAFRSDAKASVRAHLRVLTAMTASTATSITAAATMAAAVSAAQPRNDTGELAPRIQ